MILTSAPFQQGALKENCVAIAVATRALRKFESLAKPLIEKQVSNRLWTFYLPSRVRLVESAIRDLATELGGMRRAIAKPNGKGNFTTARDTLPMSDVWSCNEWDQLEEVIVGNPLQTRFPTPTEAPNWQNFLTDHWPKFRAALFHNRLLKICN